jgi:hypothetical protein
MYSTGIGLVLKGFETLGKIDMPTTSSNASNVKTHSQKERGSFFDSIMSKGKSWFAEEN